MRYKKLISFKCATANTMQGRAGAEVVLGMIRNMTKIANQYIPDHASGIEIEWDDPIEYAYTYQEGNFISGYSPRSNMFTLWRIEDETREHRNCKRE